ncbi:hypothetical protein M231_06064 [Tremella mesenterica]|uniref:Uncharacterized protein n=1 Tax=Tremella mesenterica TaxID=5217 RepID=A0A4V1M3F4_TREME|nr:uncharacterized protein TREMEDRAFT_59315 [Tremella mesenterica DSM 1558]EIW73153.1 hypothetical protein TREMEDRAFT_59315 [Tremella mesenterica DSM 1558]RXK36677.1 hypothetical protein M231_06064 [Tremella mesenterica]
MSNPDRQHTRPATPWLGPSEELSDPEVEEVMSLNGSESDTFSLPPAFEIEEDFHPQPSVDIYQQKYDETGLPIFDFSNWGNDHEEQEQREEPEQEPVDSLTSGLSLMDFNSTVVNPTSASDSANIGAVTAPRTRTRRTNSRSVRFVESSNDPLNSSGPTSPISPRTRTRFGVRSQTQDKARATRKRTTRLRNMQQTRGVDPEYVNRLDEYRARSSVPLFTPEQTGQIGTFGTFGTFGPFGQSGTNQSEVGEDDDIESGPGFDEPQQLERQRARLLGLQTDDDY